MLPSPALPDYMEGVEARAGELLAANPEEGARKEGAAPGGRGVTTEELTRIPTDTPTWCEAYAMDPGVGDPWPRDGTGYCAVCTTELTGRQIRYCSKRCRKWWRDNHQWTEARRAALRRGRRCVRPGCPSSNRDPVEVNHILPLAITAGSPSHGATGCFNHQYNLETLCVPDHREVTEQARQREREGAGT